MITEPIYRISSRALVLRDSPRAIDFHILSGDYFLFLATAIGFMEEALAYSVDPLEAEHMQKMARELRNDLRYIHANYEIVPRALGSEEMVRPRGNLFPR